MASDILSYPAVPCGYEQLSSHPARVQELLCAHVSSGGLLYPLNITR